MTYDDRCQLLYDISREIANPQVTAALNAIAHLLTADLSEENKVRVWSAILGEANGELRKICEEYLKRQAS